jgi:hypothetical protein
METLQIRVLSKDGWLVTYILQHMEDLYGKKTQLNCMQISNIACYFVLNLNKLFGIFKDNKNQVSPL